MYADGFKYWLAYRKNNIRFALFIFLYPNKKKLYLHTSYYRCARYKLKCPGRCVREDDSSSASGGGGSGNQQNTIRITTAHNHKAEPDRVLVEKFRKVLTHRAATESQDLYTIFWEEAAQRHSDAALLYTFAAAESAMRKARRKQLPPLPESFQGLGETLMNSTLFRVHSGSNKDQFYQTTLMLTEGNCLIFAHMKTIQFIGRVDEMHFDASLDFVTDGMTYHLLTVHAVQSYSVGGFFSVFNLFY